MTARTGSSGNAAARPARRAPVTVHGVLHLLGYDHMTPEDEAIMLEKQRLIMRALALLNGDS